MSVQYIKEAGTFDITKVVSAGLNKFESGTHYLDFTLEVNCHGIPKLVNFKGFLTEKAMENTFLAINKLGFVGDENDLASDNAASFFKLPKDVNVKVEEDVHEGKVYYNGKFINIRQDKTYLDKSEAASVFAGMNFGGRNIAAKKVVQEKYKENFSAQESTIEETTINQDNYNPIPF